MSGDLNFKLNLCGEIYKSVTLSEDLSRKFRNSNYQIGTILDPATYELPLEYTYKISGGSTVSGTPARRYVNSFNPIREKVKKRRKALTVVSKFVNSTWSVADILVRKNSSV